MESIQHYRDISLETTSRYLGQQIREVYEKIATEEVLAIRGSKKEKFSIYILPHGSSQPQTTGDNIKGSGNLDDLVKVVKSISSESREVRVVQTTVGNNSQYTILHKPL